jgi:hypothetical protein
MYTADAVKHFVTKANLVRALKRSKTPRTKGAVSMWGELVPLIVAYELSAITDGKLKVKLSAYRNPTNPKASRVAA